MDFMKKTQNLAATLTKEFNCEEINLTVQMRRGEDWITLDLFQNSEEPNKFYATVTTLPASTFNLVRAETSTE